MFTICARSPYKPLRKLLIYSRLKIKTHKICPFLTLFLNTYSGDVTKHCHTAFKSRQNHCPRPSNASEPCTIANKFSFGKRLFNDREMSALNSTPDLVYYRHQLFMCRLITRVICHWLLRSRQTTTNLSGFDRWSFSAWLINRWRAISTAP